MNGLQVFKYQDREVRTLELNGEPWFVLKDVCGILSIGNVSDVCARLDADERESVKSIPLGDNKT